MGDRTDLDLHDTPALKVLSDRPDDFPGVRADQLADAQLFLRVSKRMLSAFDADFSRHNLSPGRYAVLMALHSAAAPLAPSKIAERVGVTPPTMTGLIAGLEKANLVQFVAPDSEDGRRKSVALSKSGHALINAILPNIFARMCAVVAAVSKSDLPAFRAALNAIEAHVSANRESNS